MLKKLFSYDFKWMFKRVIIVWCAMIAVTLVCVVNDGITKLLTKYIFKSPTLTTIFSVSSLSVSFLFEVTKVLAFTFCLIMAFVRFYRNLYSSEGYFTLCTPIKQRDHVLCKFAVTLICVLLTFLVSILASLIRYSFYENPMARAIYIPADFISDAGWLFSVELVIVIISASVFSIFEGYLAISFGQVMKNKVVGAILFYFVIAAIIGLVGLIVLSLVFNIALNQIGIDFDILMHIMLWLVIVVTNGLSVLACCITVSRLKNKINLE